MTTLREAAQRLLTAIDIALPHAPPLGEFDFVADAAADLRAALAAPVAWPLAPKTGYYDVGGKRVWLEADDPFPETPSPKRKPLTDEECDAVASALDGWARSVDHYEHGLPLYNEEAREVAREVIRAAHGIKEEK